MREIKFRAWNKQARKMFNIQKALFGAHGGSCFRVEGIWFPETKLGVVTREDVLDNPTIMPEIATMNVCDDPCGEKTEHCVLMQYTGLKDKNGVEIYEGDIIRGYFTTADVDDHIWLRLTDEEKESGSKLFTIEDIFYPYQVPLPPELEVIGNIYENPDLLNNN